MLKYGTVASLTVQGQIRKCKFEEGTEGKSDRMKFEFGKPNYRGKEKPDEWANYYVTVFGKTASILRDSKNFGDGCVVSITGDHDQRRSTTDDGRVFIYNNIQTNDATIVVGLEAMVRSGLVKEPEGDAGEGGSDDAISYEGDGLDLD